MRVRMHKDWTDPHGVRQLHKDREYDVPPAVADLIEHDKAGKADRPKASKSSSKSKGNAPENKADTPPEDK